MAQTQALNSQGSVLIPVNRAMPDDAVLHPSCLNHAVLVFLEPECMNGNRIL